MHVIAAKAVALGEILQPGFKSYAQADQERMQGPWLSAFVDRGYDLVSGGTDNHLILIDLQEQGPDRQDR